jgi:hypothetical protein
MESWRAVYAHTGRAEVQNRAMDGLYASPQITLTRERIRIRIEVGSGYATKLIVGS